MLRCVSPFPGSTLRVLLPAVAAAFAACGEAEVAEPLPEARRTVVPAPPSAAEDPRPTLIAFGDSLTAGYGLDLAEAWPARLQELLDAEGLEFRVVNAGVSGETTSGGLRRLPWVLDRNPAAVVVVIALGGNDGLRGVPVDVMTDNIHGMIEEAEGRGLRVLLAGVPTPPELGRDYEEDFAAVFREAADAAGAPLLPSLLAGVAGVADLNQRDGIHPNAAGARLLADNAFAALRPLLTEVVAETVTEPAAPGSVP